MSRPLASIVIRAKNEEALIGETLSAVYRQTLQDFEVIVVDSGSTDRTVDIARRFPVRLLHISPASFTFGRALNIGCAAAAGRFLVPLSAHAVPLTPDWLSRLLRHFDDTTVAGVWGGEVDDRQRAVKPAIVRQTLADFLADIHFGMSSANGAIRRNLWETQPFDESLTGTEDKEWAYRILLLGYALVYDSTASVYHHHQNTLRQDWWRSHREYVGFARFLDTLSLLDVTRRAYWDLAALAGEWRAGRARPPALARALPRALAQALGRYTGRRKGRQQALLQPDRQVAVTSAMDSGARR